MITDRPKIVVACAFVLFLSGYLVVPSAEQPCACVDLGTADGSGQQKDSHDRSQQQSSPADSENPGANGDLSARKDNSTVDTYGNEISRTQESRIDGFRGSPWGATPDEILNNESLGKPSTRDGRDFAKQHGINLPDEGKSIWVYKEEIMGSPSWIWLAFEEYHEPGQEGLIWTATLWRQLEDDDHDRITTETYRILKNDYGNPTKTDEGNFTERQKPNFTSLSNWTSAKLWEDDYGRLTYIPRTYHHGTSGRIAVYYQSRALLEKRQESVKDAEAKF